MLGILWVNNIIFVFLSWWILWTLRVFLIKISSFGEHFFSVISSDVLVENFPFLVNFIRDIFFAAKKHLIKNIYMCFVIYAVLLNIIIGEWMINFPFWKTNWFYVDFCWGNCHFSYPVAIFLSYFNFLFLCRFYCSEEFYLPHVLYPWCWSNV